MVLPYAPVRWLIDTPNTLDPDVFPLLPGQMFVSDKGPEWETTIIRSRNGRERSTSWMSSPRWHFHVAYEVLREEPTLEELSILFAFFNSRAGRHGKFWYRDPSDHTVTNQNVGTGNGVATIFQLTRTVHGFTEPVFSVDGTPTIYKNGVPVSPSDYEISDYGVLTFDTAPASEVEVTWTGQFRYWCRFDDDKISASEMVELLWSSDGVKFVSVRP